MRVQVTARNWRSALACLLISDFTTVKQTTSTPCRRLQGVSKMAPVKVTFKTVQGNKFELDLESSDKVCRWKNVRAI